ncbi:N-acetylglucosamine-6-phosphate deacetylase [Saccharopolyspora rosea]|uniref:N-acetylglucosamine-6-phosphate deacetylase n=1 Tax=Saccharopolyspora rosea TaxID=524884 RepID=A0ABW3FKD8_9PSEU|nr:N-acetylglucosamine-6-phosphate deacetylase [Saccharopolyspora rosea]
MNTAELTLAGGRVVTPDGVLEDGWVRISGGHIAEVGTGPARGPAVDLGGRWLVPGFVDIHCHGGGGGSFTGIEVDQAHTAITAHRAHGTTTMLASLVSASLPDLAKQISGLADLVTDGLLAGIHLEGPFLSAARCGAHDPAILRPPETAAVQQLLDAGQGAVRMVTLAPELDNAENAVRQLVDHGVIAAVGHTDAVLEQVVPAVEAGATVATHLFNGMRPLHHREPGPIGVLMEDERVTVELICDLVHLHPTVVKLAASHAGTGRTVLVTDAISATGAGDGTYELGKLPVTVVDGEPRLADGSLAGSTLTMDVAFRNMVTCCGLSVPEAVAASSTRPAALLGLADRVGAVRCGLAADLVVLDADLRLTGVIKDGAWASGEVPLPMVEPRR